uniref:aspartate transaminase n=1 Tax=Latimeria chalumnae TaxID=7897 RepID=M3XLL5_LATCH
MLLDSLLGAQNSLVLKNIFFFPVEYLTNEGQSWVLPVVRKVQLQIANDPTLTHEYVPSAGQAEFTRRATELVLGRESHAIVENRTGGIQAVGGTGALRIGAEFLQCWYKIRTSRTPTCAPVYISSPAWENHQQVFQDAGFEDIRSYRYWDSDKLALATNDLMEDMENAIEHAIIVLYVSSHHPTGVDPSVTEWEQIAGIMRRRKLFPFFYLPSQGFASGDLDQDAWPIRHFVAEGFELFCAQSFSENFCLYSERVGNLVIVTKDNESFISIKSQIASIARAIWGSPGAAGARIVTTILNNPALYAEWKENLKVMLQRMMLMREKLKEKLRILGTVGSWEHIPQQNGMHCFLGLNSSQIEFLVRKKHIYLLENGRINICGLNSNNLEYVAQSIHEAVKFDCQSSRQ